MGPKKGSQETFTLTGLFYFLCLSGAYTVIYWVRLQFCTPEMYFFIKIESTGNNYANALLLIRQWLGTGTYYIC